VVLLLNRHLTTPSILHTTNMNMDEPQAASVSILLHQFDYLMLMRVPNLVSCSPYWTSSDTPGGNNSPIRLYVQDGSLPSHGKGSG
jgi:hypothetical protein